MYFKIKDKILFRQYAEYGYITDNAMFGYQFLNDTTIMPGEKYVSDIAAIMLGILSKEPQNIEDIVRQLLDIFVEVEYDELKQDTVEFFMQLVDEGFLSWGETFEQCNNCENVTICEGATNEPENTVVMKEDCSLNIFSENDFLRSIHIEIANECNERCVHCYIPHEFKCKIIDADLFYRIVEEGRSMNIINVTISGGEPLLHKDFLGFLSRCRELDLSVNVLTNLTLLSDDIVSEMKKNPLLSVQTSLYSMDPLVHDSITKVNGSFEKTKDSLLKLISAGIPVQISCPIMKQNKNSFVDVINWGNANNIAVSVDYVIFAAYDHSNSNLVNRLSLEEVETAFDKQLTKEYAHSLNEISKEKSLLTAKDPICTICRYYFCVSAEGDVFPCVGWQTNKMGNLNEKTIKEIWESSKKVQKLRQIKRDSFPKCVECKDRGYCTVCMMCNSNENNDGDAFRINDFHCKVASMIHSKVDMFLD
ncbi:MAG: radical SAM protein [Roseburia sp.]|nr:radical SAM protein [Roseburia sp.]